MPPFSLRNIVNSFHRSSWIFLISSKEIAYTVLCLLCFQSVAESVAEFCGKTDGDTEELELEDSERLGRGASALSEEAT